MADDYPRLPEGFVFGTSTAAYQIEGAAQEDGRGPSIWDTFCAEPGRIKDGSSGAVACDHYHRVVGDVALMRRLGAQAYRFSISWPRIQPTGKGEPNRAGLAFYDRLLDELLAAGIEPMATLYHWDLPQALQDEGGWQSRETPQRFAEYAAILGDRFGDRVTKWVPVNEPNVVTVMGHALAPGMVGRSVAGFGPHAPALGLGFAALPVAHHLNLAHGLAVSALRERVRGEIGTATNHMPVWPESEAQADRDAALLLDVVWNWLFADPMLVGRYPEGFEGLMDQTGGSTTDWVAELRLIHQPLDFYGFNYYNPVRVAAAEEGAELPFEMRPINGYPMTDIGWPVVPEGLGEMIGLLRERYAQLPPLYVTENGCACNVGPDAEGVVDDQPRIEYLDAHLRAVADAIAAGADVRGYYCWSLIDNFEWAEGYTQRFGLVHVDYETQVRTPKRSFDWYAGMVRANRGRR